MAKVKKRDNLEDPGIDGYIYFKNQHGWKDVDWTHWAQETDKWRTLMNIKIKVSGETTQLCCIES